METRRILLEGVATTVVRDGDDLVAGDGRRVAIVDATHLPPVVPSKILCVHLNYRSPRRGVRHHPALAPTYFHKPVSALNAHEGQVVRPERCEWLNYEGEIAIVIGRTTRNVSQAQAWDAIAGYTVANDYGLHDFRDTDAGSMLRVKGSDTLCPLGPGLVTADAWDPRDGMRIRTLVNGEVKQDGNTADMEWDMAYLVADLARTITLEPGDVILSGTPANSRPVVPATSSRSRSRGSGRCATPSSPARRPSATTSAPNRPSPRRCARPRWAETGSSAASAPRGSRRRRRGGHRVLLRALDGRGRPRRVRARSCSTGRRTAPTMADRTRLPTCSPPYRPPGPDDRYRGGRHERAAARAKGLP